MLQILKEVTVCVRVICTLEDFLFQIQNNHQKYTFLLMYTAKLPQPYSLTNSGIKSENKH